MTVRRAVESVRASARRVALTRPGGAFGSAGRGICTLAVLSSLVVLPDLLRQGTVSLLVGSAGLVLVLVAALGLRRRWLPEPAADLLDAAGFVMLTTALTLPWEAPLAMSTSLWHRSLGGSRVGVAVRTLLYTGVLLVADYARADAVTWIDSIPALSAVPVWVAMGVTSRRLGLMLKEHDAIAAVSSIEVRFGASMVGELDEDELQSREQAHWRALAAEVPHLLVVQVERLEGRWVATDSVPEARDGQCVMLESWRPEVSPDVSAIDGDPSVFEVEGRRWREVPLADPSPVRRLLVGMSPDVSERHARAVVVAIARSELIVQHARDHLEIRRLARTDQLTGLASRLAFFEALHEHEGSEERVSVMFFDLDRFKEVNDAWGHDAGDEVLRAAAHRIREACGEAVQCARLGGDEFAALFVGADDERLETVTDMVAALLKAPIATQRGIASVGVSCGYASTSDGEVLALLPSADARMYSMKGVRGGLRSLRHEESAGAPQAGEAVPPPSALG
ncbi:GGDEF domain-containing protein [Demequina zhanjiangensis]|uniref:GGDEF domain-containing protein n=1 Tax=Demequina zhanjiangensis TaxID=3051659 RepID=A0ABT8G422_9MICO|nr:GGDEF domain-containing protein [Demequina sp. SYSU T00b26]MDN4473449.1 GGDEF domain-containing protein [Demequina sp. SYSU T00b26]